MEATHIVIQCKVCQRITLTTVAGGNVSNCGHDFDQMTHQSFVALSEPKPFDILPMLLAE